ncbi:MAG: hypothetical protein ACHQAX_01355 [Gammaproteobacteria bacterium]
MNNPVNDTNLIQDDNEQCNNECKQTFLAYASFAAFISVFVIFAVLFHDEKDNSPSPIDGYASSPEYANSNMGTQSHSNTTDSSHFFSNFSEKLSHGDPASIIFMISAVAAMMLIMAIIRQACSKEGLGSTSSVVRNSQVANEPTSGNNIQMKNFA